MGCAVAKLDGKRNREEMTIDSLSKTIAQIKNRK